jgi:hypothetical protein
METNIKRLFFLFTLIILHGFSIAQFPPPAGQPGSTAIHKDSNIIIGWADDCIITRGFIDMTDTLVTYNGTNKATYGSYLYVSGPADEYVVSLGDRGLATVSFNSPIMNGQGPDFIVFENSFGDLFLELAFVEVSSDGNNFVRFPATTLVQDSLQIQTFGTIDATLINNFAGKYRMAYGTPFDLEEIKDSIGINVNNITHIRIIDVGGCVETNFASIDSKGHIINDPWPTPFDTGGFDLDAIGVLHNSVEGICGNPDITRIRILPNPFMEKLTIDVGLCTAVNFELFALDGQVILKKVLMEKQSFDLDYLDPGLYIARIWVDNGIPSSIKIIKK